MSNRRLGLLPLAILLACSSPPTGPSAPAGIELISGGGQQGVAGYPLPEPVVVRVVDERGNPVRDVELKVTTNAPLAVVQSDDWHADADGRVEFRWRMGASVDGETIRVSVVGADVTDALTISAQGGSRPVRAIAGGLLRYCVVTIDQRLGCWHAFEESIFPRVPVLPPTINFHQGAERFIDLAIESDAVSVGDFGCAIRVDGGVSCFDFEPGLESLADLGGVHPPFTRVFANQQSFSWYYCALTADGEAWCWGENSYGQLGNGTTEPATIPTRVATDVRFGQLSLGGFHGCGLDTSGAAWCWGSNVFGATGTGSTEGGLLIPAPVSTPIRFATISTVADHTTCGRTVDGAWWCWGRNVFYADPAKSAVPLEANVSLGTRLATPDDIGLSSDGAGNAMWWGDLYPTMDLVVAAEPRAVKLPFPLIRFAPAVQDMAACSEIDTRGRWLCVDLLWLWYGDPSDESGSIGARPLVHGVP